MRGELESSSSEFPVKKDGDQGSTSEEFVGLQNSTEVNHSAIWLLQRQYGDQDDDGDSPVKKDGDQASTSEEFVGLRNSTEDNAIWLLQRQYGDLDDDGDCSEALLRYAHVQGGSSKADEDGSTEAHQDKCLSETRYIAASTQICFNMLQACRSLNDYERLNRIWKWKGSAVYRARDKETGEIVTLKKVKRTKLEGFPASSLGEIQILASFEHSSVVYLKAVTVGNDPDSTYLVMEYVDCNLKALLNTIEYRFSQGEVKCLMLQLLEGVKCLHGNFVIHRNLKPSHLLLNARGELKICGFGGARRYGDPLRAYTPMMVDSDICYRAPELLLGEKVYSPAIDMWSVGCIMAELLSNEKLFAGEAKGGLGQVQKIFGILGTPNEKIWPGFSKLPGAKFKFLEHQNNLRSKFPAVTFTGSPALTRAGFDLLQRFLTYDPEQRITAEAALKHEWFEEFPLPIAKNLMPTLPEEIESVQREEF